MVTDISSEAGLRKWLRREWRAEWGPLIWCEAARGGTVGAPDVFVPVAGYGYVPVELKYWPRKILRVAKSRLFEVAILSYPKIEMRPAQRRLHRLIGAHGIRSVVLSYLGHGSIGVSIGCKIAKHMNRNWVCTRDLDIDQFRKLITLNGFWEAGLNAKLARASGNEQQRKEHRKRATKTKRRL
jgi:hypothetical protein